jgi:hypothetical protein
VRVRALHGQKIELFAVQHEPDWDRESLPGLVRRAILLLQTPDEPPDDRWEALRKLSCEFLSPKEAQQQKQATASAQESLQIFPDRYIGGADPYLQVLTAQTIALQNERNDVDILRRRMDVSVLLIKA